jgi:hypothetical protein
MCVTNDNKRKTTVSDQQLAANRANATLSTGPRTQEGKAASSRNSLSHGLCSTRLVVFLWESQQDLDHLRASFHARFRPLDRSEVELVDRLVDSTWRRKRILAIESTLFDLDISNNEPAFAGRFPNDPEDGILRIAIAFRDKHGEGSALAIQRYLTSVECSYTRASRELEKIQKERFNCLSADEILAAAEEVALAAATVETVAPPLTTPPQQQQVPEPEATENTKNTERTHFQPSLAELLLARALPNGEKSGSNGDDPRKHQPGN